jgi:hypothetical protein
MHDSAHVDSPQPAAEQTSPAASQNEFDARIAQAMAAFDRAPEPMPAEPEAQPQPASAINLNETKVLPQEALLSLEQEMKQAFAEHAPEAQPAQVESTNFVRVTDEQLEAPDSTPETQPSAAPEATGSAHEVETVTPHQAPGHEAQALQPAQAFEPPAHPVPVTEKMADAVHRAIERLKPQLIAEIVKELKRE